MAFRTSVALRYSEQPQESPTPLRQQLMSAYDALPEPVRAALRDCPFDVHITMRLSRYSDPGPLVERIQAIRSAADAQEFNRQFA